MKPHYRYNWGNHSITPAYEGASTQGRLGTKGLVESAPDVDVYTLQALHQRADHIARNNPTVAGAVETYASNMLGATGVDVYFDDEQVDDLWQACAPQIDYDGHGLLGLCDTVLRGQFIAGNAFGRHRYLKADSGLPVPYQMQLLDAQQLAMDYEHPARRIYNGIEYDADGKRAAYHMWKNHPLSGAPENNRLRIPASSIVHVYRRKTVGQALGVSELAPAISMLYAIDELNDATLIRHKVAAFFAAFVQRNKDAEESDEEATRFSRIVPGTFHYLDDDEHVVFPTLPDVGAGQSQFISQLWGATARSLGFMPWQITGDMSGISYSSVRAGLIEVRRRLEMLQNILLINQLLRNIATQWVATARYHGLIQGHHVARYQAGGWEWVDPYKQAAADRLELEMGVTNTKRLAAKRGVRLRDLVKEKND